MPNHLSTQDAGVYRCPACAFHAIATQQGIRVLNSGIGRALHMEAIAQQQIELRAYVEALLRRLVRAYNERRGLPSAAHDFDDSEDRAPISMRKVRELSRHIRAEYLS